MSGFAREKVGCLESSSEISEFGSVRLCSWRKPPTPYDGSRGTHSQTFSRRGRTTATAYTIPSVSNPSRALSGTLAAEEHKHVTYLAHTCVTKLTNPSQAWPQGLHMNCYNCVCMCFGASLSAFMSQQPSKEIDQTVGKSASQLITAINKSNCNG